MSEKAKGPTDAELAKWAREWHWEDCKRESIDHTIYPRDLRMVKACVAKFAALSQAPATEENNGR